MAHTAKYLEGALVEIMTNNMLVFGVNVVDPYQDPVSPQVINAIGPASEITARIRIDKVEYYRVNTLASLTAIQIANFHIDCWHRTLDGINLVDNDGGMIARIWQLVSGLTEAANVGDVNWANITNVKILYADPPDYKKAQDIQHRVLYGVATWN